MDAAKRAAAALNVPYSVCAVTAVAMSDARNVAMSPTSLVDSCCFSGARRAASSCNPCVEAQ